MTIKQIFRKVVYAIAIITFIAGTYFGLKYAPWQDLDITKCGTVVTNLEKERTVKNHIYNDLYLGVKYDDGEFEAVLVSPTTYMQKSIGDRVCFKLPNPDIQVKQLLSLFYWIVVSVLTMTLLIVGVIVAFHDDKEY